VETEVTALLEAHARGDVSALGRLLPLVYAELKRVARRERRRGAASHTLSTTVLVHEMYLKLVGAGGVEVESRRHFMALCSRAMRQLLVDHARARLTKKRGAAAPQVELAADDAREDAQAAELLAFEQALAALVERDAQLAETLELAWFGGLDAAAIAEVQGINVRTVQRRLQHELANTERDAGEYRTALVRYREIAKLVPSPDDVPVDPMLDADYGRALLLAGEVGAARMHVERGASADLAKFGDAHYTAAIHGRNRALLALHEGNVADAVARLERAAAIYRTMSGDDQYYAAQIRIDLAYAWLAAGRVDAAAEVFDRAYRALLPLREGGHPAAASARLGSALAAARRGERETAVRHADEAVALRAPLHGAHHALTRAAAWLRDALAGRAAPIAPEVRAAAPFEVARLERAYAAIDAAPQP